jgi:predicted ATPase
MEDSKLFATKIIDLDYKSEKFLKDSILEIGRGLIKDFKLTNDLVNIYNKLFLYFTGNGGYDLSKGIYLYGGYGVGKTITMRIFSLFLQKHFNFGANNFGTTSVEKIADYYKEYGNLIKYGRSVENGRVLSFNTCINEFGKPLEEKHYGTRIQDTINSMLMNRYELFQEGIAVTHATSNYHPSKLDCFDEALIDRFKEMFNFIEVKGKSFRNK